MNKKKPSKTHNPTDTLYEVGVLWQTLTKTLANDMKLDFKNLNS